MKRILGLAGAIVIAGLAFASSAYALASVTINSFSYDPNDSSGQTLVLKATNTGNFSLDVFELQLAAGGYTISNVVLSVNGSTSTIYCSPQNGAHPAIDCTFPPGLIIPSAAFTITFKVTPAYPANQSNFYSVDDGSGLGSGTVSGPTPPAAPCPSITIAPPVLPSAAPNQPYMESITASGGTAPYGFAVAGGQLPPGIFLAANGVLSGTPTTPGTYTFAVIAGDANGCLGIRNFTIDVFQPVKPPPCACSRIKLKLDPTLLNKKRLRPDQHDFGVGFVWRMTCTSGNGGCTATVSFRPPKVFAGSVPVPASNFHLNIKRVTFTCGGPCGKSTTGRLQIKMLSRAQLSSLFGRTLAYRIVTRCAGVTRVATVRVFIDDHGVLRRPA